MLYALKSMVNHTDATTMTSSLPQMLSPSGSSAVVSENHSTGFCSYYDKDCKEILLFFSFLLSKE
jgi:hypothetical protein